MSVTVDIDQPTHERILASAGSGKTYELASRFVRLVASGASPGGILASTFTRTAAGEIRDRVLLRLADAADDEERRDALARTLGVSSLTPAAVREMLIGLARQVHRLEIGTLDAFFASLAGGFALELGVPADCQIVEETEAAPLRVEAIRRTLLAEDTDDLVELLRQLTQGGSDRSVIRPIDQAITDLYALYRQAEESAWRWLEIPPGRLSSVALDVAIEQLASGPTPSDMRQRRAMQTDLDQARRGDWMRFLASGLAKQVVAGNTTYSRVPIDERLLDAYRPLVRHATAVIAARLRGQTEATHRLLRSFDRQYRKLKHEHRLITFDDLATLAERVASDRIDLQRGAPIEHVLLDEFQDTSVPQWRALEPLLRRIVATRRGTVFCVGDLKQSIYGWRDAEPEILEELPRLLFDDPDSPELDSRSIASTRRSAPPIIRVVNAVFGTLTDNAALADDHAAVEQWSHAFETHDTVRRDATGYVELRTVDGDDRARTNEAARLAAALHRRAPERRIGILTRTRREASAVLYELWREDVPASGLGGGALTEAPAVNAVLDLLTLADHPGDTAAAFHVAGSPLAEVVGAETDLALPARHDARSALARRVRRTLLDEGFAATIAGWIRRLGSVCNERELQRLVQLVEVADSFDGRGGGRCADFVRLVETKDVAEESEATVQVMTVHKAKGLEFDIVILAELDEPLTGSRTVPAVFARRGTTGPVDRLCRYVGSELREALPQLGPLFDDHRRRTVRESLCLLYVAITRAKQGLFMITRPAGKRVRRTLGGVLRCALAQDRPTVDHLASTLSSWEPIGELEHADGDLGWLEATTTTTAGKKAVERPSGDALRLGEPGPTARASTRGSAGAPAGPLSVRSALRLPDEDATDRGSALHALLQRIQWLEEGVPEMTRLLRIAAATAPRRGETWARQQVELFLEVLEKPAVRAALGGGPRDPESWQVWRERPYARIVEGVLERGTFDRVEVEHDLFGSRRAVITDFKTDQIGPSEAAERAESYRPQLERYRDAVAELLSLEPERVATRLLFVIPGLAIDV